jgi:putative isomerase
MQPSDYAPWLNALSASLSPRDARLLALAAHTLTANILEGEDSQPLPWAPWRGIIPSPGSYRGIWNWDAAFHAVGVAHWDAVLAREQIRILLDAQLPSGALPDVIFADGRVVTSFGKPPVMPWALAWVDGIAPDLDFLAYAYPKFVAYEQHWRAARMQDGLFFYDSADEDPEQRDLHARLESGWDNSVRWDKGARRLWPADLNGYMVLLYRALAYFAWRLGKPGEKGRYEAEAARLGERIETQLFDPARGCYLDRDRFTGEFSPVQSPACFIPLYIQTASPQHAKRMAQIAADPDKFYPWIPTVAYDDPEYVSSAYWRGPSWLNTAYFAAKGLKDYGFHATADAIRETVLNGCDAQGDALYEYYDSRAGQGLGARQFGWSAAFVINFILDWNGTQPGEGAHTL